MRSTLCFFFPTITTLKCHNKCSKLVSWAEARMKWKNKRGGYLEEKHSRYRKKSCRDPRAGKQLPCQSNIKCGEGGESKEETVTYVREGAGKPDGRVLQVVVRICFLSQWDEKPLESCEHGSHMIWVMFSKAHSTGWRPDWRGARRKEERSGRVIIATPRQEMRVAWIR